MHLPYDILKFVMSICNDSSLGMCEQKRVSKTDALLCMGYNFYLSVNTWRSVITFLSFLAHFLNCFSGGVNFFHVNMHKLWS